MPEPFRYDDPRWHFDDPIVRFDSFVSEPTTGTNMNTNKISAVLSTTDQATALANILANDTLLTFVVGLTKEQKQTLNKAANKRIPFITKALTYAQQHPTVLPGTFSLPEFAKDVALGTTFAPVVAAHDTQNEKFHDTITLAWSEAYDQARLVRKAFENANGNGEYDTILAELAVFFEDLGNRPATPSTP
jgi:hypothetical protein